MTKTVSVTATYPGGAKTPFEAGQLMAHQVLDQALQVAPMPETVQLALGLFSGAMCMLQATIGTQDVEEIFGRLLAATKAHDAATAAPPATQH